MINDIIAKICGGKGFISLASHRDTRTDCVRIKVIIAFVLVIAATTLTAIALNSSKIRIRRNIYNGKTLVSVKCQKIVHLHHLSY